MREQHRIDPLPSEVVEDGTDGAAPIPDDPTTRLGPGSLGDVVPHAMLTAMARPTRKSRFDICVYNAYLVI
jgi:hypothetical protein